MTAGTHHTIECELGSVSPGDVPPEMTVQIVDDICEQRANQEFQGIEDDDVILKY